MLLLGVGAYALVDYLNIFENREDQKGQLVFVDDNGNDTLVDEPESEPVVDEFEQNTPYKEVVASSELSLSTEIVARDLTIPWGGVFTSPFRILITERPGRVLELGLNNQGIEQSRSVMKEFPQIQGSNNEEGLMAITLDPQYESNKYVYLAAAFPSDSGFDVDILRYTDTGSSLEEETVVLDNIPGARFHAGTQIRFGPDGFLYVSTGDALDADSAQDLNSLNGKLLRIDTQGRPAPGNPFNTRVFAYGFRNPQGFDFSPEGENLIWLNDHGPSGFDGPRGGDEVNLVLEGENYGWPLISHSQTQEDLRSPNLEFTPAVAPGGSVIYKQSKMEEFYNDYFFGGLAGEGLYRVILDPSDTTRILAWEKLDIRDYGRIRAVFEGPDGYLYFTTSNTDGRGNVQDGDDKLVRLRIS